MQYWNLVIIILAIASVNMATLCRQNTTDKSNLCRQNLHEEYIASCVSQIPKNIAENHTDKDCLVRVEENTTNCRKLVFSQNTSKLEQGAAITIQSYCRRFQGWTSSGFNVTLRNITWNDLTLRFKDEDENLYRCISFSIPGSSASLEGWELFYDCLWRGASLETRMVTLEYMIQGSAWDQVGSFIFKTPQADDSGHKGDEQFETLTYVEHFSTVCVLHIQKLDVRFEIDTYFVKNCFCENFPACDRAQCHPVTTVNTTNDAHEMVLDVDIRDYSGCFYFVIEVDHMDCLANICNVSKSPVMCKGSGPRRLTLSLTLAACILLAGVMGFVLLWHCRNKNTDPPPTVLLIHDPVSASHVKMVLELKNFLTHCCGANVLLDITDIPRSHRQDPFEWYSYAVRNSKLIGVISSPRTPLTQEAVYKDLFMVGIRQARGILHDRRSNVQLFCIVLKYPTECFVPSEFKNLPCFVLTKDIKKMVSYIQNSGSRRCVVSSVLSKLRKTSYELNTNKLKELVNEVINVGLVEELSPPRNHSSSVICSTKLCKTKPWEEVCEDQSEEFHQNHQTACNALIDLKELDLLGGNIEHEFEKISTRYKTNIPKNNSCLKGLAL